MKTKVYFILPIVVMQLMNCFNQINAQDTIQSTPDTNQKIIIYRTWITLKVEPYQVQGVLYEMQDSAIIVSDSYNVIDYLAGNFTVTEYPVKNIEDISIRRKNNPGRGLLIGWGTGFVFGFTVGMLSLEDDPPCGQWDFFCTKYTKEDKALGAAFLSSLAGMGFGALVGSQKTIYLINGSLEEYSANKGELENYSFLKNQKQPEDQQ